MVTGRWIRSGVKLWFIEVRKVATTAAAQLMNKILFPLRPGVCSCKGLMKFAET